MASGIAPLDELLAGGIAGGRISEIIGGSSSGRTTLAMAFVAAATQRGETVGWIESSRSFDPASATAAGVDLKRLLWASANSKIVDLLKGAELILKAGGFSLVVIDLGAAFIPLRQSAALRLAREAERSGAAVIAIAANRVCGTFAALSLKLSRSNALFSRITPISPALFEGFSIDARVVRNKLGGTGAHTIIRAAVDPFAPSIAHSPTDQANKSDQIRLRASNS